MSDRPSDHFDGLYRYEAQLRREDWAAFVRLHSREWRWPNHVLQVSAILVGVTWGLVGWGQGIWGAGSDLTPSEAWRVPIFVGIVVSGCALLVAAVWFTGRLKVRRRIARWRVPPTRTRVDIFSDHVAVREDAKDRFYSWAFFKSIELGENHVFLVASDEDVIILPLTVFDDRADMLGFYHYYSNHTLMDIANGDLNAPKTLQTTFSVTAEDARLAHRELANGTLMPLWKAAATTGILGGVLTGGLYGVFTNGPSEWLPWLAAAWPGSVLLTALGAWRLEAAQNKPWPISDPRGDKRDISLKESGFYVSGKNFETRVGWASIEEVRDVTGYILVVTEWREVYVVPKRCFPDAAAAALFVESATGWQAAFLDTWKRDARKATAKKNLLG